MNDAAPSAPLVLTPDERIAGVLIPSFALRADDDLGIGDIGTLRRFVDWAATAGFALVQLLPINETGGDNSPYNAISSMALDPATLETTPAALEDLSEEDYRTEVGAVDLAALKNGPVQYSVVKPLKRRLLKRAFARFRRRRAEDRRAEFERFQAEQAKWLETYTLFRTLMDENGGTECWDRWPAEQSTAEAAGAWLQTLPVRRRDALQQRRQFHAYVQWIAYSQWEALKRHAESRGVALMGDIPLGVSYYSADYFGQPGIFEQGWSGGAPPEPYFKDDPFTQKWGQNWGIPVYNWSAMKRDDYAWWRQRIGGVHNLFHVFRIDHILGFYRIYSFPWRPERNPEFLPLSQEEAAARTGGDLPQFKPRDDESWENKAANCRNGERLLRVALEAAGDTRLIGEDLGTVPDYVRPNLTSLGIAGFKIPIWEPDHRTGRLMRGSDYQRLSLATYGTHDHEPLLALWKRWHTLSADERHELRALADFAEMPQELLTEDFSDAAHQRLIEALLRTNSWIAICMITDVFGREERFNVPGTAADSNWSQRMHLTMDELESDPACQSRAAALRGMVERTGRKAPAV